MNGKSDNSLKKYFYAGACLFGATAASIILFFVIYKMDTIGKVFANITATMMPFIIGAILAYIICPLCNMLERLYDKLFKKLKNEITREKIARTLSVFTGILIALIAVYIMLMIIIPQLISSVVRLVQILPAGADTIVERLRELLNSNETLLKYSEDVFEKVYEYVESWLSDVLLNSVDKIAAGVSTGVINVISIFMNVFIGVIVAIYLLFSRKKLARQANLVVHSIFKKKTADAIIDEVKYTDKVFSGFINGKILDAVIIALICYLGMMIFKLFNPGDSTMSEVLVAVIVGIFNVIPFFGWYIGLFISAVLILLVNPVQCIFFIIFDIILQQIDGNIIGPKILGNTTGISSLWVLFAIFLFGDIWGFAGMLIGVPLFAVIYHGIKRMVFMGLKRNGMEEMALEYERDYPEKPLEDDEDNNNKDGGEDKENALDGVDISHNDIAAKVENCDDTVGNNEEK